VQEDYIDTLIALFDDIFNFLSAVKILIDLQRPGLFLEGCISDNERKMDNITITVNMFCIELRMNNNAKIMR
jgi:hypothetical protein